jgi:uncharacterized tellurite resistance protein B-like protein
VLDDLKRFLDQAFAGDSSDAARATDPAQIRLAIAALLVEMSRADYSVSDDEREAVARLLRGHFTLEKSEAEKLLSLADERADEAVSLHEFTRAVHENLSDPQKHRLIEMLLEVALSDGHFDKHERHLLSKVADLIYVRRVDYNAIVARVLDRREAREDGETSTS